MSANQASPLLHSGIGADGSMKAAHNTTVELTCTASDDDPIAPIWFIDEAQALSQDGYVASRDGNTGKLIGILIINGNETFGTFRVNCSLSDGETTYSAMLTVES